MADDKKSSTGEKKKPDVFKISGPLVSDTVKKRVGILAQDAGKSVEQFLGDLVTEAIQPKWEEFQKRMAAGMDGTHE